MRFIADKMVMSHTWRVFPKCSYVVKIIIKFVYSQTLDLRSNTEIFVNPLMGIFMCYLFLSAEKFTYFLSSAAYLINEAEYKSTH